jgi:selenocysteine lyase/cysteine desulfurase
LTGRLTVEGARDLWDPEPGWLNTASYGLPPRPAWEAMQDALEQWRVGRTSWEGWDEATGRSRAAFAALLGVEVQDVCVGAAVSQMLAPVAAALPAGARVVAPDIEFASALFPWLARTDVTVRTVPLADLPEAVDERTDLVAFSLVQSADGTLARYPEIVAAARAYGALVVVDATQACGWLPFDAGAADAVVVHAYKWLMSPRGSAFGYLRPALRERLTPLSAGWYAVTEPTDPPYGPPLRLATSARRFDISPAWFSYVATAPALEVVQRIGVPEIHRYDLGLANQFRAGLGMPPGDSPIVALDLPGAYRSLTAAGVRAAVRRGGVRVSFHVYTTQKDVRLALDALGPLVTADG